ncbi:exported hypothetical protein [metagenome]|uniref:Lipoprotein n=1 Tax=metagenome TaxID=256318 RepID=A0A2P2C5M6_9ZZZZ
MPGVRTRLCLTMLALLAGFALSGCGSSDPSTTSPPADLPGTRSCERSFEAIVRRIRRDAPATWVEAHRDRLRLRCPSKYAVLVDYTSVRAVSEAGGKSLCAVYANHGVVRPAVKLARRDGLCTPGRKADAVHAHRHQRQQPRWACFYAPTMDRDWHNDVVCTDGRDEERPYLRAWDSFVTQDEIMASAHEYERQLNDRN